MKEMTNDQIKTVNYAIIGRSPIGHLVILLHLIWTFIHRVLLTPFLLSTVQHVNISAKMEYACIAVLELAKYWGHEEPLHIRDIAEAHGIPPRFLVQILLQLKGAGLVNSTRGATGGYYLSRTPDSISLLEVMSVIDGPAFRLESNIQLETPTTRVLLDAWNTVATTERNSLASITFADLQERLRNQAEEMYYI